MTFEIELVKEHFGAYVDCQNVSELSPSDFKQLKLYLSSHGLLIFKNQKMDDEALIHFSLNIGNGELEESARRVSLSNNRRYIAYLTNLRDEDGTQLGFPGNGTDFWHSDQEFRINPASVSILYGEVLRCNGGKTSFASTSTDYLGLSAEEMTALGKLWSTRQPAVSHDNVPHITVSHPVVIENERTKNKYIYISENTINFLENDQPLAYSKKLKETMLEKILSPDNIYSHTWSEGDLILYDNSQLLHRREAFTGDRFIKAMKIYPDTNYQSRIPGRKIEETDYVYYERA